MNKEQKEVLSSHLSLVLTIATRIDQAETLKEAKDISVDLGPIVRKLVEEFDLNADEVIHRGAVMTAFSEINENGLLKTLKKVIAARDQMGI